MTIWQSGLPAELFFRLVKLFFLRMRKTLSVAMIAMNEEANLPRTLRV